VPTEILRPNAAGAECNLSSTTGCPNSFQDVDEAVPDGFATTVSINVPGAGTFSARDLYDLPPSGVGVGTITKITVSIVCDAVFVTPSSKCVIRIGGNVYEGAPQWNGGWGTSTEDWLENPDSVAAWTWADIGNLQIGVWLEGTHVGKIGGTYCTQVFVTIHYTLGWTGKIMGLDSPVNVAKIMGIPIVDIDKIIGVG